jgi:hypothetical protein
MGIRTPDLLHAMRTPRVARCRQTWPYQQFRSPDVARRRLRSPVACSRLAPPVRHSSAAQLLRTENADPSGCRPARRRSDSVHPASRSPPSICDTRRPIRQSAPASFPPLTQLHRPPAPCIIEHREERPHRSSPTMAVGTARSRFPDSRQRDTQPALGIAARFAESR